MEGRGCSKIPFSLRFYYFVRLRSRHLEVLAHAREDVARDGELVGRRDAHARADLVLPLPRHHLRVGAADLQPSEQARAVFSIRFDSIRVESSRVVGWLFNSVSTRYSQSTKQSYRSFVISSPPTHSARRTRRARKRFQGQTRSLVVPIIRTPVHRSLWIRSIVHGTGERVRADSILQ